MLAPITPFLAEALYQNLVRSVDAKAPESVHLCDWPVADAALISPRLHDETALVMRMVNLGRAAREKAQIRVRQPLATLYVRVGNESEREALERLGDQVLEELNVKRLEFLRRGQRHAALHRAAEDGGAGAEAGQAAAEDAGDAAFRRYAGACADACWRTASSLSTSRESR